jgi:integrase
MRRDHLVPLLTQALAILRELHAITGKGALLFPSIRSAHRPMSDNTLNAALRRLGYADRMDGNSSAPLPVIACSSRRIARACVSSGTK